MEGAAAAAWRRKRYQKHSTQAVQKPTVCALIIKQNDNTSPIGGTCMSTGSCTIRGRCVPCQSVGQIPHCQIAQPGPQAHTYCAHAHPPFQTACAGAAQRRQHTCPGSLCPCEQTGPRVWRSRRFCCCCCCWCRQAGQQPVPHTLQPGRARRMSCQCQQAHAAGCPCRTRCTGQIRSRLVSHPTILQA